MSSFILIWRVNIRFEVEKHHKPAKNTTAIEFKVQSEKKKGRSISILNITNWFANCTVGIQI